MAVITLEVAGGVKLGKVIEDMGGYGVPLYEYIPNLI